MRIKKDKDVYQGVIRTDITYMHCAYMDKFCTLCLGDWFFVHLGLVWS
jgi:hypothetical protein